MRDGEKDKTYFYNAVMYNSALGMRKKRKQYRNSESAPKDLRELNEECITIKTGETEMDTETEGTVQLSVEFPDYKSLYLEANESENPEKFVQEALQQKKFKTCKAEITARVAVENGETVIYKEEAINQLLEKELTDAINALAEE